MFGRYYGLRGTPLNIAIGVIAGMDFLLCMSAPHPLASVCDGELTSARYSRL